MATVLDFAGTPPDPAVLRAQHPEVVGTMRYVAPLPNSKCITPSEAAAYWAAGYRIGLVWEGPADPTSMDPTAAGKEARRQSTACGFPTTQPICVALDKDASRAEWPALAGWYDLFRAAAGNPDGYGPVEFLQQMKADGHVTRLWVPAAWDDDDPGHATSLEEATAAGACLYQQLGQINVAGTTCDVNIVINDDWGGYLPGPAPTPTPTPSPQPVTLPTGDPGMEVDARCELGPDPNKAGASAGYCDVGFFPQHIVTVDINGQNPASPGGAFIEFDEPTWEAVAVGVTRIQVTSPEAFTGWVDLRVFVDVTVGP